MPTTSESGTPNTTILAVDRTYMAATRTLLSLLRSGAAISGAGPAITDLLVKGWPRWMVMIISTAFVILGYLVMWSALRKGRKLHARLAQEGVGAHFLFPLSEVTAVTVGLQVLLLVVLVLYLFR